jgi:hypothetical protein
MKPLSSLPFTHPDGRLTKERPTGEDFFLVHLAFETPDEPCWYYAENFVGSWRTVRQGLSKFLAHPSSDEPEAPYGRAKVRIQIYQGSHAREMIARVLQTDQQRREQKLSQPNN